jgi:asparagine synthase (glutamine-hydrolysing)
MAHSVECRVPFLTPALVEFCLSLPDDYLIDADGVRKAVFRTAMSRTVPEPILGRSDKIGFSTPDWLRECSDQVTTLLGADQLRQVRAISASEAMGLAADVRRGEGQPPENWWRALCLVRWSNLFNIAY